MPDLAQYTTEIREMGERPSWSPVAHDLIRDSNKTANNDGAGQKQEEGITRRITDRFPGFWISQSKEM